MIERLIENWLTNTSERGYEAAFCQLLMAEGHRLVHIDRHTGTEHGKDIITYDQEGKLCAFQLKCGNINVEKWRSEVEPEILELVEYPVLHPSAKGFAKPYLVTTGRINENVNGRILARNAASEARDFQALNVIQGSELVSRFVSCHGRFFPQDATDLHSLLKSYLADGRDHLDKDAFASFLEGILPRTFGKQTDAGRAISSSLIFAAYALNPYERCQNYHALFEGWTLVASYIARLSEALRLRKSLWISSFDLATGEAWYALEQLCEEAIRRNAWMEGDVVTDGGPVFRARATILCGLAGAYHLARRWRTGSRIETTDLDDLIRENSKFILPWGESAVPFLLTVVWRTERQGRSAEAEAQLGSLLRLILGANPSNGRHNLFPGPYHSVSSCLAHMCGIARSWSAHDNPGASYAIGSLIDMLARRNRKQLLSSEWYSITDLQFAEMRFDNPWEFYSWRTPHGELHLWFAHRPTKWRNLRREALAGAPSQLPERLRERPDFAMLFLMVYPHRLCRSLAQFLDGELSK